MCRSWRRFHSFLQNLSQSLRFLLSGLLQSQNQHSSIAIARQA
ncbi:hypothetical protein HanPI659440_Chr15g0585611 [Helianthus annuus]|nr:hypothetical protein HanPI659440_Chr15g0585611 [Helianthus annuus]